MKIEAGWLNEARRKVSPYQDARPDNEVSVLVLHSISLPPGQFGGPFIEQLFTSGVGETAHPYFQTLQGLRVSAHLLIRRDGECVQFVSFDRRAWHAGRSRWKDGRRLRNALNDFAIGIELEGDEVTPDRQAQYASLAGAIKALVDYYPALTLQRLTSHAHIAPLRKTDPGPAFDWAYLRDKIRHLK